MKRLLLVLTAFAAAWSTSCSSGGSTTVTPPPPVGFSNSSLKGTYVFSVSGSTIDPAAQTVDNFSRVGVFIADGGGNIETTGGLEDQHQFGSDNQFGINGGGYVVNSDGRGTLCLETSSGEIQYSISLSSTSSGYMVDMGTVTSCPGTSTNTDSETASGSFQLQSATTLANGTYIFDFSGIAPASGDPISIIGDLVASGTGGTGSFASGSFADVNDGGTLIPKTLVSGGYQVDNNNPGTGRGTATINGLSYVYYVIDGQHAQMMEIDADQVAGGTNLGEAVVQQIGDPTNVSSFNGSSFVFVVGGTNVIDSGPHTRAVRLTATGGSLSAILLDDNNEGSETSVPSTGVLSTGTVTLDGDGSGRGTFSFTENAANTFSFVFYLSSATQGVIQDVSTTQVGGVATPVEVADGTLLAQTGAPFSSSSLATNYAFNWSGVTASGEEDYVGSFAPASATPNGLVDFNEFGSGLEFINNTFNGVVTVGGDGTGSTGQHSTFVAGINGTPSTTINYFAYIANSNTILIMGTANQGSRVIAGVLTAQTP
jgi:hypothetical protein